MQRPTDERRVTRMLENANVRISAWDGERLVGFLRAMTDYTFDCCLNDLAVDPAYQRQGLGRELVEQLRGQLEDGTLIFLLSAKDATEFYMKYGFKEAPLAYGMLHKKA